MTKGLDIFRRFFGGFEYMRDHSSIDLLWFSII